MLLASIEPRGAAKCPTGQRADPHHGIELCWPKTVNCVKIEKPWTKLNASQSHLQSQKFCLLKSFIED